MRILTEKTILNFVWALHKALESERDIKPHMYRHPLKNVVINNRLKRALGRASNRGRIEIAGYFVGLEYTKETADQLFDTILHELAHLYVGISEGHNEKWQRVARYMGTSPEKFANVEGELKKAVSPPWLLVATLSSGKRVKCKTAYKRTFKYLNHPHAYDIGGEPVKKFEWVKLEKRA